MLFALLLTSGTISSSQGATDAITIRLGTILPSGKAQHRILQEFGESCRKASGGQIKIMIFPSAQLGDEMDMVRRMRVGQLSAGLFSVRGLTEIDPAGAGLQYLPMAFRSWDEVDYVREKMRRLLEQRLEDKGFVVLFWADMGWVRFFSKEPRTSPEDFKRARLFVWAGDTAQVELMKGMGYRPVPLETTDILTGLNTRMIDALPVPPLMALASQVSGPAPHMLDLKWVPIVGAAVIKKEVWNKIPQEWRGSIREAADEAGRKIRAHGRIEDGECIQAMQGRGLKVHPATPEIEDQWRKLVEKIHPKIRGTMVPVEVFDEVQQHLKAYREAASARP